MRRFSVVARLRCFVASAGCALLAGVILAAAGCGTQAASGTAQHDGHGHTHAHGEGGGHSHSSGHAHGDGHSHSESLYGGQLVEIGHSHHGEAVESFQAEIVPIRDGQIVLHFLSEDAHGHLQPLELEVAELPGYVNKTAETAMRAREVIFRPRSEEAAASAFVADLPESLSDSSEFTVVIPKVVIGRERFSFSFEAARSESSPTKDETSPVELTP